MAEIEPAEFKTLEEIELVLKARFDELLFLARMLIRTSPGSKRLVKLRKQTIKAAYLARAVRAEVHSRLENYDIKDILKRLKNAFKEFMRLDSEFHEARKKGKGGPSADAVGGGDSDEIKNLRDNWMLSLDEVNKVLGEYVEAYEKIIGDSADKIDELNNSRLEVYKEIIKSKKGLAPALTEIWNTNCGLSDPLAVVSYQIGKAHTDELNQFVKQKVEQLEFKSKEYPIGNQEGIDTFYHNIEKTNIDNPEFPHMLQQCYVMGCHLLGISHHEKVQHLFENFRGSLRSDLIKNVQTISDFITNTKEWTMHSIFGELEGPNKYSSSNAKAVKKSMTQIAGLWRKEGLDLPNGKVWVSYLFDRIDELYKKRLEELRLTLKQVEREVGEALSDIPQNDTELRNAAIEKGQQIKNTLEREIQKIQTQYKDFTEFDYVFNECDKLSGFYVKVNSEFAGYIEEYKKMKVSTEISELDRNQWLKTVYNKLADDFPNKYMEYHQEVIPFIRKHIRQLIERGIERFALYRVIIYEDLADRSYMAKLWESMSPYLTVSAALNNELAKLFGENINKLNSHLQDVKSLKFEISKPSEEVAKRIEEAEAAKKAATEAFLKLQREAKNLSEELDAVVKAGVDQIIAEVKEESAEAPRTFIPKHSEGGVLYDRLKKHEKESVAVTKKAFKVTSRTRMKTIDDNLTKIKALAVEGHYLLEEISKMEIRDDEEPASAKYLTPDQRERICMGLRGTIATLFNGCAVVLKAQLTMGKYPEHLQVILKELGMWDKIRKDFDERFTEWKIQEKDEKDKLKIKQEEEKTIKEIHDNTKAKLAEIRNNLFSELGDIESEMFDLFDLPRDNEPEIRKTYTAWRDKSVELLKMTQKYKGDRYGPADVKSLFSIMKIHFNRGMSLLEHSRALRNEPKNIGVELAEPVKGIPEEYVTSLHRVVLGISCKLIDAALELWDKIKAYEKSQDIERIIEILTRTQKEVIQNMKDYWSQQGESISVMQSILEELVDRRMPSLVNRAKTQRENLNSMQVMHVINRFDTKKTQAYFREFQDQYGSMLKEVRTLITVKIVDNNSPSAIIANHCVSYTGILAGINKLMNEILNRPEHYEGEYKLIADGEMTVVDKNNCFQDLTYLQTLCAYNLWSKTKQMIPDCDADFRSNLSEKHFDHIKGILTVSAKEALDAPIEGHAKRIMMEMQRPYLIFALRLIKDLIQTAEKVPETPENNLSGEKESGSKTDTLFGKKRKFPDWSK